MMKQEIRKIDILILAAGQSTRMIGINKLLKNLNGVTLVEKVVCQSLKSKASNVSIIIQKKDLEIENVLSLLPVKILKTSFENIGIGYSISKGMELLKKNDPDGVLILLGDMPDITENIIRAVEGELQRSDVATAFTPMDFDLRNDPNSVKMIHNRGRAHWFLRASLEYGDHHLGIYGYNREAKAMYSASTKFVEEDIEKLEQLRWIQNGVRIGVVEVEFDGIEINTPEDLEKWQTRN